jgi:hypothetical protein
MPFRRSKRGSKQERNAEKAMRAERQAAQQKELGDLTSSEITARYAPRDARGRWIAAPAEPDDDGQQHD